MNFNTKTNYLLLIGLGLIIALSVMIPTIFNKPPLTPSETISAFHESIIKGKTEETKTLLTNDIRAAFESGTAPWYVGTFGDFMKDHQDKYKSIKPTDETIAGSTATVTAEVTYRDNSSETKEFFLIKEEDKWKIAE